MYINQAEAVKEWLQAYQKKEQYYNGQLEKLRMLQARMRSVPAQELSDMPRPPSTVKDRMAEYAIRIESLEKTIEKEGLELEQCRDCILELTGRLRKVNACKLIRSRYLYSKEWPEIMKDLYGAEEDFREKENTYRRKMYRLHQSALKEMSRAWTTVEIHRI